MSASVDLAVTPDVAAAVARVNGHTALARELLDLLVMLTEAGARPRLDEGGIFRADLAEGAPRRVSVAVETLQGREPALRRLHARHLSSNLSASAAAVVSTTADGSPSVPPPSAPTLSLGKETR